MSGLVGRYHGLAHLLLPTCCRWGSRIVCGLRAQRLRHGGSWGGHPGLCVGALPPCFMSSLSSRSSSNSSKSSEPSSAVALSAFGMRPLHITLLMRWISLHYKRSNLMAVTSGDGLGQHWMIWRGFVTCKLRLSCLSRTSYEHNHKAHLRHDRKHLSSQIGYAAHRAFRAVTGTMLAMCEESGGRAISAHPKNTVVQSCCHMRLCTRPHNLAWRWQAEPPALSLAPSWWKGCRKRHTPEDTSKHARSK